MATDANEVVVGANGHVYVAPVGTTGPTDSTTALDAAFIDVGYISEDGAGVSDSKDIENIGAWQSLYPLRRIVTGREFNITFALRQWNATTVPFAFGGGDVTDEGGGEFKYVPPAAGEIDERALVLEWEDGDKHYRLHVPRGMVAETVDTTFARNAASDLPITYSVLPVDDTTDPYELFTDDPAFAAAS